LIDSELDISRPQRYDGHRSITQAKGAFPIFSNLGFSEVLLILVAALVIFGPSKLPELGRSLGQSIREFKRATQSFTDDMTKAAADEGAASSESKRS
jgi:sec-independent protein translocase protein TatA